MPRGYRSIIFAAAGCLALAASPERHDVDREQSAGQKTIPQPLATAPKASATTIKLVPPYKHDRPCKAGEQNRESELCAEWQAADQSRESTKWAARSFWVGLAGVVGLLASLYYTRKAVKIADDATTDTDKALAIAERNASGALLAAQASTEGNVIAREAMQLQIRPYVYLLNVTVEVSHMITVDFISDTAELTISIKNYGQSPAKAVRIFCKANVGDYWSSRKNVDLSGTIGIELGDIPFNEERTQNGFFAHGVKAAHKNIVDQTMSIFVEGKALYHDSFGNEHVTLFQRAFTGNGYWSGPAIITPHWNSAT